MNPNPTTPNRFCWGNPLNSRQCRDFIGIVFFAIEGAGLIAEFESAGVGELSFLPNGLVGFINSTSSRFRRKTAS